LIRYRLPYAANRSRLVAVRSGTRPTALDAAIGINTGNPDFGNRPGQRAGVQPICSMSSICDGANAGAIPFRRSFWVVTEAGGVEMVFIWFHKLS
jgi:hypothetical protein